MRFVAPIIVTLLLAACALSTSNHHQADAQQLIGNWNVDLRPKPDAPAYFQGFTVSSISGKSFTGSFYGASVEQARINTDWGTVRIAFTTSDQSGPYHHSAVLVGKRLEGLTNSTGRDFLAYWTAAKP